MHVLAVALGAALGACLRHGLGRAAQLLGQPSTAALVVANVGGSLAIGIGAAALQDPALRALVLTGFCGSLTTFSSFTLDNVLFTAGARGRLAVANVLLSVVLGVGACALGLLLGRGIVG